MSRVATPTVTPSSGTTNQVKVPHEKIAMRAYEKWCKLGCPQGTDLKNWLEAEAEIRAEMTRMTSPMAPHANTPTTTPHATAARR